ncbi:MAG TPA: hypothetical protein VMH02_13450 [Verrucomicrobiae bacterium]|nr:hypothetical protein [Verrucomicrobiae bacterium]
MASPTTVTSGVSDPYAVAFDSADNLYVGNENASTVTMYAASSYTAAPVSVSTSANPLSLLVAGNTLYVGEGSHIDVFALPLTNAASPTATLSSGIHEPYGMTLDGAGNLYVANSDGGSNSSGSITEFTTPFTTGNSPAVTISEPDCSIDHSCEPFSLGFAGGDLYVVNQSGGQSLGGVDEYATPISSSSTPLVSINTSSFAEPYFSALTPAVFSVSL